jgi:hypothetical protein
MSEIEIRITPQQDKIFQELTGKYNIIRKGRRFGFTHGFMLFSLEKLLMGGGPILWGDTINGNIDRYFQRFMLPILNKIGKDKFVWNAQKRELRVMNINTSDPYNEQASIMDFRSSDAPENWEGFGYKWIILNEAGIILKDEYLYKNAVLPMLLDYPDSKLIAGGVPKGKTIKNGSEHPFYTLSKKAESGDPRYKQWIFTSYDSAVAKKTDIDELVADYGGANHPITKQEIFAEFIDAVDMPFLYEFHETLHVSEEGLKFNPQLPVYLAWDFNVKSTCLVIQFYENQVWILKEYHERGIETICQMTQSEFNGRVYINGDASGNNDNAANETYYNHIQSALRVSWDSFRVPKSNPKHKASYRACNLAFKYLTIRIDKSCKGLIRDCNLVQILQKGDKIEIDKSDQTLTHHLDPLRYFIHAEMLDNLTKTGVNLSE